MSLTTTRLEVTKKKLRRKREVWLTYPVKTVAEMIHATEVYFNCYFHINFWVVLIFCFNRLKSAESRLPFMVMTRTGLGFTLDVANAPKR